MNRLGRTSVNLGEGTRRLALVLGLVGVIFGGLYSYSKLQAVLNQREWHNRFERLASADEVKKLRASLGKPSIDSPGWNVAAVEVHEQGIKAVHLTGNYGIESIETEDGQTLYPTAAPSAWANLLVAIFPVLGFLIPWSSVHAIRWVVAGFAEKSR